MQSVLIAKRIHKNISSGRKIFKFLKFIDELKNLAKEFQKQDTPPQIRLLVILSRVFGFFYYLLDNIVWFTNVGMLSRVTAYSIQWKQVKYWFTLFKNIVQILKNFIIAYSAFVKEKQLFAELERFKQEKITYDS